MSSQQSVSIKDLTYTEVGETESTYLNGSDLVCTINYRITKYDAVCKMHIDMIKIEHNYRNQKLSKPILLDFIDRKQKKPVCLENMIGTDQFQFPQGATTETKSALRNLYSSIGFRSRYGILPDNHPNYNDMILTTGGHKRLKTRNKRSKSKNKRSKSKNKRSKTKKRCINKKNYKSKNGRKSTVKIFSKVFMKD